MKIERMCSRWFSKNMPGIVKVPRGFTLMELMIVIGVLSVLIGIAVPRIKGFQEQAKIQKAKSELKTLEAAITAYHTRNNSYPPTTEAVSETYLLNDTNPLIDRVLYDPFGDGTQEYNYLVDGNYWAVSSRGADRVRNVPVFSSNRLLIAAGVDDLAQTNGIVATCAEGGYTDCGGSCNDLQTDADNCGTCGTAGGPDCCAGLPVDLTDEANCGTCGNVCGADYVCEDGACIDACERTPGDVCLDGSVFVAAGFRTTATATQIFNWQDAIDYCVGLNGTGMGDGWQFASINDLETLWPLSNTYCADWDDGECVDSRPGPIEFLEAPYLSSTESGVDQVWIKVFTHGASMPGADKDEVFFRVRCVRKY